MQHQREVLGVITILARDSATFGAGALAFCETATHLVAIASERDRREERELSYRADFDEAGPMAALGLLTATVAHELRGPLAALEIQLNEQHQLLARPERSPSPFE